MIVGILKIGKHGNPNYDRVYDNQTYIRFELGQRRSKIKSIRSSLFEDFRGRHYTNFFLI